MSRGIMSNVEPSSKTLLKLNSKLAIDGEIETGYVSPGDMAQIFDKVKIADGVKLTDIHLRNAKQDTTTQGTTAFRITKNDYNRM